MIATSTSAIWRAAVRTSALQLTHCAVNLMGCRGLEAWGPRTELQRAYREPHPIVAAVLQAQRRLDTQHCPNMRRHRRTSGLLPTPRGSERLHAGAGMRPEAYQWNTGCPPSTRDRFAVNQ
jgi:hypothetical protein